MGSGSKAKDHHSWQYYPAHFLRPIDPSPKDARPKVLDSRKHIKKTFLGVVVVVKDLKM